MDETWSLPWRCPPYALLQRRKEISEPEETIDDIRHLYTDFPILVRLSSHLVHLVDRDVNASIDLLRLWRRERWRKMDGRRILYAWILLVATIALTIKHIFGLHHVSDGLPWQLMSPHHAYKDAKHSITISRRAISLVWSWRQHWRAIKHS